MSYRKITNVRLDMIVLSNHGTEGRIIGIKGECVRVFWFASRIKTWTLIGNLQDAKWALARKERSL